MHLATFLCLFLILSNSIIPLYDEAGLKAIGNCLSCHYVLLSDIEFSNIWMPIGDINVPFTGSLDGQGHTIGFADFAVSNNGVSGLFGAIQNAKIINIRLDCSYILTGLSTSQARAFGLLAGVAKMSTVYGCAAILEGAIGPGLENITIGGFFGVMNDCSITRCFTYMLLSTSSVKRLFQGGLAGSARSSTISDCEVQMNNSLEGIGLLRIGGLIGIVGDSLIFGDTKNELGEPSANDFWKLKSNEGITISNCKANVSLDIEELFRMFVGAVVGSSTDGLLMLRCSINFFLRVSSEEEMSEASLGGVLGDARYSYLVVEGTYSRVTMIINILNPYASNADVGGLIGFIFQANSTINQCATNVNIRAAEHQFRMGGLVGSVYSANTTLQNNGALGILSCITSGQSETSISGLVGYANTLTMLYCYFIGELDTQEEEPTPTRPTTYIGGIGGLVADAVIQSCYAVVSVRAQGTSIVAGGSLAMAKNTSIANCYAATNITAHTYGLLILGGFVGQLFHGSVITDSFAIESLEAKGSLSFLAAGGFAGYFANTNNSNSVERCYTWGTLSVTGEPRKGATIGGFLGMFNGTGTFAACIAYVTITSKVSLSAGLLIGTVLGTGEATVSNSVAYVVPDGSLLGVRLAGPMSTFVCIETYCAKYPRTGGCKKPEILNTKEFLRNFDFLNTFQLSDEIAEGNLALWTVPVLQTGSSIWSPHIVMPRAYQVVQWPVKDWVVSESVLGGFPYLSVINYTLSCLPFNDCYGFSSDPINAVCNPGWSSPKPKSSKLSNHQSNCNVFTCHTDADCNNFGTCMSGACKCCNGYKGLDCSQKVCPEYEGTVCGFNACRPLMFAALIGVCQCQRTEFLIDTGICLPGCPPVGFGICTNIGTIACFEGYSEASSCTEYDCSKATTDICRGRGTCTSGGCLCSEEGVLLGGNCYTACTAEVVRDCVTIDCGLDNACANHGKCAPSLDLATASCLCNVDGKGQPRATHFGGQHCEACETGYVSVDGDCVENRCPRCDGGQCLYSETEQAIVCTCLPGQEVMSGKCVTNNCGDCQAGACRAIPNGADPHDLYCVCDTDVTDGSCFVFSCPACTNGTCVPNRETMQIQCACPGGTRFDLASGICKQSNRSSKTYIIAASVSMIGATAVVVAAVVTVWALRRRKRLRL